MKKKIAITPVADPAIVPVATKPTKAVKPTKIGINAAAELILGSKGRIFSANVVTKKNPDRIMTCRLGVQKGVKGTGKNSSKIGMINVFDMQLKEFRTLNLQEVTSLRINKQNLVIK